MSLFCSAITVPPAAGSGGVGVSQAWSMATWVRVCGSWKHLPDGSPTRGVTPARAKPGRPIIHSRENWSECLCVRNGAQGPVMGLKIGGNTVELWNQVAHSGV